MLPWMNGPVQQVLYIYPKIKPAKPAGGEGTSTTGVVEHLGTAHEKKKGIFGIDPERITTPSWPKLRAESDL